MTLAELLDADVAEPGSLRVSIGRELHGAFGGAFGGVVAAAALMAARSVAPGRTPAGLDVRFLRGLPAGTADVKAEVVHAGRSLTVISVDIHGPDGRHATRATVSLVDEAALHPLERETPALPLPSTYDTAPPWASTADVDIPMLATLAPRVLGRVGDGIASALRLPWRPDASTAAEAACFAADLCVGPPVATTFEGRWMPHPNPDLSLRFAGTQVERDVIGIGSSPRVAGGVALVGIEVRSAGAVVALGVATSLVLPTEGRSR